MEDGLVHNNLVLTAKPLSVLILIVVEDGLVLKAHKLPAWDERRRLNPCCSGRWSCTWSKNQTKNINNLVLILIVVDNGLVPLYQPSISVSFRSLNPYCSGRWSRTQ